MILNVSENLYNRIGLSKINNNLQFLNYSIIFVKFEYEKT
jgi:hypothetical protein